MGMPSVAMIMTTWVSGTLAEIACSTSEKPLMPLTPPHRGEELLQPGDLTFDHPPPGGAVLVGRRAGGDRAPDLAQPGAVALVGRLSLQELLVCRSGHLHGALVEVELGQRRGEQGLGRGRIGRGRGRRRRPPPRRESARSAPVARHAAPRRGRRRRRSLLRSGGPLEADRVQWGPRVWGRRRRSDRETSPRGRASCRSRVQEAEAAPLVGCRRRASPRGIDRAAARERASSCRRPRPRAQGAELAAEPAGEEG